MDWLGEATMLPVISANKCSIACNSYGGPTPRNWVAVARFRVAFTIMSSVVIVGVLSVWCFNLNVSESRTVPDSVTLSMTQ